MSPASHGDLDPQSPSDMALPIRIDDVDGGGRGLAEELEELGAVAGGVGAAAADESRAFVGMAAGVDGEVAGAAGLCLGDFVLGGDRGLGGDLG